MIKKFKLNQCQNCKCKENLKVVYDTENKLFFLCPECAAIYKKLINEIEKTEDLLYQ